MMGIVWAASSDKWKALEVSTYLYTKNNNKAHNKSFSHSKVTEDRKAYERKDRASMYSALSGIQLESSRVLLH